MKSLVPCAQHLRGHLQSTVCGFGLQCTKKKTWTKLEQVQQRAINIVKGLQHMMYEERLKDLSLFSLENRKLNGDIILFFSSLLGDHRQDGVKLFSEVHSTGVRGNWHKLQQGKF